MLVLAREAAPGALGLVAVAGQSRDRLEVGLEDDRPLRACDPRDLRVDCPLWVILGSGVALTLGTALGGWRIARTIGRRIYDLRPLDGLASQAGAAGVILGASVAGAPVSTTHVVASSVVGTGGGRGRWSRVRWTIVREMGVAWVTTVPATALMAAALFAAWRLRS